MSGMSLFITCPVESVERATAFYTALGWTLNAEMSDHNVSCFAIAPEQYVMLGSREMYASVGGAEELIGGPDTPSKVTVSFDLGSREAVDELGRARRCRRRADRRHRRLPLHVPAPVRRPRRLPLLAVLDEAGRRPDRVSDLAAALDIVGARWALLIVERLLDGPQRYGDLQRDLGVPTNMLATRLRELEAAGVLSRLPLRHNTRAYALTDRGLALREAIEALGRWGDDAT